jgi:hypothetical protein
MRQLLTFFILFLMLGGVAVAEIITINCKLSEYVVFDANGIKVDKNNKFSIPDEIFKIDTINKKIYKFRSKFELIENVSFDDNKISWTQEWTFASGSKYYNTLNRITGVYNVEATHDENSLIRKGRGLYRQTYTSKCESVKKKF